MERKNVCKSLKRNSRNLQIKLEKERKEISSLSFKPKISMTSTNLCRKNNLFLINDFYERNTKWKEEASKNLKNQVVIIYFQTRLIMKRSCMMSAFSSQKQILSSRMMKVYIYNLVNKLKKDKTFIYKKKEVIN